MQEHLELKYQKYLQHLSLEVDKIELYITRPKTG